MRKRRVKIKKGDIIAIPISSNQYCYGQFIEGDVMEGCYIIFDGLYEEHPLMQEIVNNPIIFLTFTTAYKIAEDEWKIIGNVGIPDNIEIPKFKVDVMENGVIRTMVMDFKGNILSVATENEIIELKTMKSFTSTLVEDAIKAKYGVIPWEDYYNRFWYQTKLK